MNPSLLSFQVFLHLHLVFALFYLLQKHVVFQFLLRNPRSVLLDLRQSLVSVKLVDLLASPLQDVLLLIHEIQDRTFAVRLWLRLYICLAREVCLRVPLLSWLLRKLWELSELTIQELFVSHVLVLVTEQRFAPLFLLQLFDGLLLPPLLYQLSVFFLSLQVLNFLKEFAFALLLSETRIPQLHLMQSKMYLNPEDQWNTVQKQQAELMTLESNLQKQQERRRQVQYQSALRQQHSNSQDKERQLQQKQ